VLGLKKPIEPVFGQALQDRRSLDAERAKSRAADRDQDGLDSLSAFGKVVEPFQVRSPPGSAASSTVCILILRV
jgi:hypothetical protein